MSVRRSLILLAVAVSVARCGDGPHPTGGQQPVAPAPHLLAWAGGSAPQFTAIGAFSGQVVNGFQAAPSSGRSLDRSSASFWAVRGQQRSVQINYLSSTGDTTAPFLGLTITDPAWLPGLGDL